MCTYLKLILSAVLAVLCAHTQEKNTSAHLQCTAMYRVSYHSLGIDKQLYMYIPVFVMYHLFSLVHPQAKHTFSAQLCNRLAQPCICIMAFVVLFVVCTILWENESLQLHGFFKKWSSNQNWASETFSCANIFLQKGQCCSLTDKKFNSELLLSPLPLTLKH